MKLHSLSSGGKYIYVDSPITTSQTNTPPLFESPPPWAPEDYYWFVAFFLLAFMMCSYAASRFFISYLTLFNVSVI
jgi:hypothetical protein